MDGATIAEICTAIPAILTAVAAIIVAIKANNKADANTTQLASHIEDPTHP